MNFGGERQTCSERYHPNLEGMSSPEKKESKRNLNVSIIFKIFECMGKIEECLVTRMKYYTSINYFDVFNKLPKLVYIMNINWHLI